MLSNSERIISSQACGVIQVKWLHFSAFFLNDEALEIGHPKVSECFDGLAQLNETFLLEKIRASINIRAKSVTAGQNIPYTNIEMLRVEGLEAVGMDGRGITCKDVNIFVNVQFHDSNIDNNTLLTRKNDIINYLDISLRIDDLVVFKTGAYDYQTQAI